MQQKCCDLSGSITKAFSIFQVPRLRFYYGDDVPQSHVERPSPLISTYGLSGHAQRLPRQYQGNPSRPPASGSNSVAIFALEELKLKKSGARYKSEGVQLDDSDPDRPTFSDYSASSARKNWAAFSGSIVLVLVSAE